LVRKKHLIEVDSDLWAAIKAYAITRDIKINTMIEELLIDGIKFNINHQPKEPIFEYMRSLIKERIKNV